MTCFKRPFKKDVISNMYQDKKEHDFAIAKSTKKAFLHARDG